MGRETRRARLWKQPGMSAGQANTSAAGARASDPLPTERLSGRAGFASLPNAGHDAIPPAASGPAPDGERTPQNGDKGVTFRLPASRSWHRQFGRS